MSLNSLTRFEVDSVKEMQGVWVGEDIVEPNPDGSQPEFLIRSTYRTNVEYEKAKAKWRKRHLKGSKRSWDEDEGKLVDMLHYAFADACWLDWRNIKDLKTGEQIPFDRRHVHQYRLKYPKLFDKLLRRADELAEEEKEVAESIEGESSNTSSTKSSAVET